MGVVQGQSDKLEPSERLQNDRIEMSGEVSGSQSHLHTQARNFLKIPLSGYSGHLN